VQHERHYTLDEASAARPWVAERVRIIREAIAALAAPGVPEAIDALDPQMGGGWPGREAATATLRLNRAWRELDALDVVVRDPERGLVDFPSLRDGREVYLCWLVDEPEIAHWHDLEAGFAGRESL
jgi:hypothetical protein